MAKGGHVFGTSAKNNRSAKHTHEFQAHTVGAGLQRHVCGTCGAVSINPLPPTNVRPSLVEVKPGLFSQPKLAIVLDEVTAQVGVSWRFGERRARR
jgi:hypothetical protein